MRKREYEEFIKKYEECMKKQEEEIKQLKECIKEIKGKESEGSVWNPGYEGEYWYVSTDKCRVYRDFLGNFDIHEKRLNMGNVYKTEEEAEFQLEKMKVLGELKKFSCKFRKGESNHYIFLNCNTNELGIGVNEAYISLDAYFESNAKAKEAIEEIGESRIKKYLFEVE